MIDRKSGLDDNLRARGRFARDGRLCVNNMRNPDIKQQVA